jgi:protein phosphatase
MLRIAVPSDALVVLVAPAGAGKSTFASSAFRETEVVSSDRCRALVSDDENDQTATDAAYEVFYSILRGRLALGRLSVADATNLQAESRKALRELAAEFGRPVVALALDVPLPVCVAQNAMRSRRVPDHVIEMHYRRYELARAALAREGYHAWHVIGPETAVERAAALPESAVDEL